MADPHTSARPVDLPRVLIDGSGTVWVRDWQEGVDRYLDGDDSPGLPRSEPLTYAEIESRWGVSTWLVSSKSVPS